MASAQRIARGEGRNRIALRVFAATIPRSVRLAEAPSFGLSAILHDKTSRGAQAYLQLAEEILRRAAAVRDTAP